MSHKVQLRFDVMEGRLAACWPMRDWLTLNLDTRPKAVFLADHRHGSWDIHAATDAQESRDLVDALPGVVQYNMNDLRAIDRLEGTRNWAASMVTLDPLEATVMADTPENHLEREEYRQLEVRWGNMVAACNAIAAICRELPQQWMNARHVRTCAQQVVALCRNDWSLDAGKTAQLCKGLGPARKACSIVEHHLTAQYRVMSAAEISGCIDFPSDPASLIHTGKLPQELLIDRDMLIAESISHIRETRADSPLRDYRLLAHPVPSSPDNHRMI